MTTASGFLALAAYLAGILVSWVVIGLACFLIWDAARWAIDKIVR